MVKEKEVYEILGIVSLITGVLGLFLVNFVLGGIAMITGLISFIQYKYKIGLVGAIIGLVLIGLGVYYVANVPVGNSENHISLDPANDLLTSDDVPSGYSRAPEHEWEAGANDDVYLGIPYDNAASRFWENPQTNESLGVMGFVCPTEANAKSIVSESNNFLTSTMENKGYSISNTSFPTYGEKTESFRGEVENFVSYCVTFRVKNVAVIVATDNLPKSETKSYCELVEERIKGSGGETMEEVT